MYKTIFKSVFLIILVAFVVNISYAIDIIINGKDGGTYKDNYDFKTNSNTNISINLIDKFSSDYTSGKRIKINQSSSIGSGILKSELYGDFYIKNNDLFLIKDNTKNLNCTNISYSFSGILNSEYWGDFNIKNSYYCPDTQIYSITINSDSLGEIILGGTSSVSSIASKNARGEDKSTSTSDIFDDKKISITGLTSLKNNSGTLSEYSDKKTGVNVNVKIEGKMMEFNSFIDKNLLKYTIGLSPIPMNNSTINSLDDKIAYYDFEGKSDIPASNEGNEGLIQELGNGGPDDNFKKIKVDGQKLLYIKGGNLYINADIYNKDSNSLLVIVVKRDSTNKKNGGNIYIDPDVTNIDAVLIADGSIISYDKPINKVLNAKVDTALLGRQLLIYGSISTKNTFGNDKAIYGTDTYIRGQENVEDFRYNLANLRSFQTTLSTPTCPSPNKIVSSIEEQYAFAGKKKCYLDDTVQTDLRSTEKITPIVIEYNPTIQTNPHFILKK